MFHATRTYLISGAIAHSGICKQRRFIFEAHFSSLFVLNRPMKANVLCEKMFVCENENTKEGEKKLVEKYVEFEFFPKLWDSFFLGGRVNS